jgi:hypothetical protein
VIILLPNPWGLGKYLNALWSTEADSTWLGYGMREMNRSNDKQRGHTILEFALVAIPTVVMMRAERR